MKSTPDPRPPAETVAFDTDAYRDLVSGFAARIRSGPMTLIFSGPTARQRGAVLAELSDAARLPLCVVPLETRFAARAAQTLANLREDFDATSSTTAILCFRHADGVVGDLADTSSGSIPPPADYIFQRARHVKGAVVLSLDDASTATLLADRADLVITFDMPDGGTATGDTSGDVAGV